MCPVDISYWEMVAEWVSAIGTIVGALMTGAVVFIAAKYSKHVESRNRPNLVMMYDYKSNRDNTYLSPAFTYDNSEELWTKIKVKNESKTLAENVQLRLYAIKREGATEWDTRSFWWFKVSNLDMTSISISPKFPQDFDIAYVKNDPKSSEDFEFYLMLVPPYMKEWETERKRVETDIRNNILTVGGMYCLIIAVLCSNAHAKFYKMEVNVLGHDGFNNKPTNQELGRDELKKRMVVNFCGEVPESELMAITS